MAISDAIEVNESSRADGLTKFDIHDVLRNERRTRVLEHLHGRNQPIPLRELSERLAALETGEDPPPRNIRESVYNSLHQTHLPKLDEMGIVSYNVDRKLVSPAAGFEQVTVYMEVVSADDVTWSTYYLLLGILGLCVAGLSSLDVSIFGLLSVPVWTVSFLVILCCSAILERYRGDTVLVSLR